VIGERTPHDGSGAHHDVPSEHRPREYHHTGSQPTAAADPYRDIAWPLGMHNLVRILIAMVLIGDVHVGSGVDIVADLHLEMPDDMTAPTDHASITDPHHRIGHHRLPRHHAGRNARVRADESVGTYLYPAFAEHRPWRECEAAA
jgi:hypothetical protein